MDGTKCSETRGYVGTLCTKNDELLDLVLGTVFSRRHFFSRCRLQQATDVILRKKFWLMRHLFGVGKKVTDFFAVISAQHKLEQNQFVGEGLKLPDYPLIHFTHGIISMSDFSSRLPISTNRVSSERPIVT